MCVFQANEELEQKIEREGVASVQIDSSLVAGAAEEDEGEDEDEEEQGEEAKSNCGKSATGNSQALNSGIFASAATTTAAAATSLNLSHGRNESSASAPTLASSKRTVQLEFVLGDVDHTPIALAEAHAEQQLAAEEARPAGEDDE